MKWVKKYDYVITAREFLHLAQPPENKEQKNFIREERSAFIKRCVQLKQITAD